MKAIKPMVALRAQFHSRHRPIPSETARVFQNTLITKAGRPRIDRNHHSEADTGPKNCSRSLDTEDTTSQVAIILMLSGLGDGGLAIDRSLIRRA